VRVGRPDDLPEMCAQSPRAHLNTNTTGFFIICMSERSKYGYAVSNVAATIVIINGPVLWISQKVH